MNYFRLHVGDYLRDASHLSLLEHGVYIRLLQVYYTREQPIADSERYRVVGARAPDEQEAVDTVLAEFFEFGEDGFRQSRCDREIAAARESGEDEKARRENERERQRRHRDRRRDLFAELRRYDIVPPFDTATETLVALLASRAANAPVTRDECDGLRLTSSQEPRANSQEGKKERESVQKRTPISRGCRIPDGFPAEPEFAWCRGSRPELDPPRVGQVFRDFHLARGSTMKDWAAAWRTWVGKERATTQPRASPWASAAEARDAKRAAFLHDLTGGLMGSAPTDNRTIENVEPARLASIAGPRR